MKEDASTTAGPVIESDDLLAALLATGFSPVGYIDKNRDLQRAGLNIAQATPPFLRHGHGESRRNVPVGAFGQGQQALRSLHSQQGLDLAMSVLTFQLKQCLIDPETALPNGNLVRTAFEQLGATPFLLIGDSHSHLYNVSVRDEHSVYLPVHRLCSGGTALGLSNPHSKSGYGIQIQKKLAGLQQNHIAAFFRFGQVDTEFAFIFHCIRQGMRDILFDDFVPFAQRSVSSYQQFLATVIACLGRDSLRVCSIFPPVLSDAAWQAGYVNAHIGFLESDQDGEDLAVAIRGLNIPDIRQRTRMHAFYNGLLQTMAAQLDVIFVDDFTPMIAASGTVMQRYLGRHDGTDHHLLSDPIRSLVENTITRFAPLRSAHGQLSRGAGD